MKHESVFERHRGGFAGLVNEQDRLNDEFDRRLAAWMEAERALSQLHIDFARDLAADLARIVEATPSDNTPASPEAPSTRPLAGDGGQGDAS
jgi:hypothetical protein